jgi:hypothetical protein
MPDGFAAPNPMFRAPERPMAAQLMDIQLRVCAGLAASGLCCLSHQCESLIHFIYHQINPAMRRNLMRCPRCKQDNLKVGITIILLELSQTYVSIDE